MGALDYIMVSIFLVLIVFALYTLFSDHLTLNGIKSIRKFKIIKLFSWQERVRLDLGIEESNWSSLTLGEREAIRDIYLTARSNNVKFKVSNSDKIEYGTRNKEINQEGEEKGIDYVSGYFLGDDYGDKPEFGIGVGGSKWEWFLIFLHESCHMDQWIEKCPVWLNGNISKEKDCYDLLSDWMNGRSFDDLEIRNIIKSCIEIELDCERRTVEKIKKYNLHHTIDVYEYTQKANSYIGFYGVISKYKKWYDRPPYRNPDIWMRMPKIFMISEKYYELDEKYLELYNKYCFVE
jgi:hypothetical protein